MYVNSYFSTWKNRVRYHDSTHQDLWWRKWDQNHLFPLPEASIAIQLPINISSSQIVKTCQLLSVKLIIQSPQQNLKDELLMNVHNKFKKCVTFYNIFVTVICLKKLIFIWSIKWIMYCATKDIFHKISKQLLLSI